MQRNVFLLKLILPLTTAWFWLGVWIIYYLRFTTYAGIGLIETVQLIAGFVLEIPTGVVADIFGKKKTLTLALFLMALGTGLMGISQTFTHLIISVLLISAGYACSSGTTDALLFDSLKQMKKEKTYEKELSKIEIYSLITLAGSSIIGGFLYRISPGLPHIVTAIGMCIGFILTLFLVEPRVKDAHQNISQFFAYTKNGFSELMHQSPRIRKYLLQLFVIMSGMVVLYEVLDGALAIQFGLQDQQLGIFFAVVIIVSAIGMSIYQKVKKQAEDMHWDVLVFFLITLISAALSPWFGLVVGSGSIILRNMFYPIFRVKTSGMINVFVKPKYRTTTLSTFTLLYTLPYVLLAYLIGRYTDIFGASKVALILSLVCFVVFGSVQVFVRGKKEK